MKKIKKHYLDNALFLRNDEMLDILAEYIVQTENAVIRSKQKIAYIYKITLFTDEGLIDLKNDGYDVYIAEGSDVTGDVISRIISSIKSWWKNYERLKIAS